MVTKMDKTEEKIITEKEIEINVDIQNDSKSSLTSHLVALGVIVCIWGWIYLPFISSLPAGVDFGAHLFRLAFFEQNGLNSEWNGLWYTGSAFMEVYPPNTTFFLWIINLLFPLKQSYVIFLVITHLLIAIGVYYTANALNRSIPSSLFAALFIMTLPNLNTNFMFYSRAPTHVGLALMIITLGLYYSEKRAIAVSMACLLSMTHFMMFGFLIVIIMTSELARAGVMIKKIEIKQKNSFQFVIRSYGKEFLTRTVIWIIPFIWVFVFMFQFFLEPIGLIMISNHSLETYTDGPGPIYLILRVFRDFLYNYITIFVFMFILVFALSLKIIKLNYKETSLLISTILITIIGFFMYYEELNSLLPLMFRGMDVLRFILISQFLIVLLAIRGISKKGSIVFLTIILLLPVAEAQNGIMNHGYLQYDDRHWEDLDPIASDLNQQEGFYYVCPYYYQGDFMAYLPALTGKPYFDGWNPPGCRLNWFQQTPPSSTKYRPNSTIIQDVLNRPATYGVKWFVASQDTLLSGSWELVTQDQNQTKWLWETNLPISLIDVYPVGNGTVEYLSANKLQIQISTNESMVDLILKVAHHPSWTVQEKPNLQIEREKEIGFMKIENVSDDNLILNFNSNHIDIVFIGFVMNCIIIAILALYEYDSWDFLKKKGILAKLSRK